MCFISSSSRSCSARATSSSAAVGAATAGAAACIWFVGWLGFYREGGWTISARERPYTHLYPPKKTCIHGNKQPQTRPHSYIHTHGQTRALVGATGAALVMLSVSSSSTFCTSVSTSSSLVSCCVGFVWFDRLIRDTLSRSGLPSPYTPPTQNTHTKKHTHIHTHKHTHTHK